MPLTTAPRPAPVAAGERLQALDVLRGFALLGILPMNIEGLAGPLFASVQGLDPALSGADRWADALVYLLVQGKFYPLFALLFGAGFRLMSERALAAGRPFAALHLRRSLALLGIGLAHALLVWSGDILVSYALLALLLLPFRYAPAPGLAALAVLALLAHPVLTLALGAFGTAVQADPAAAVEWNRAFAEQAETVAALAEAQRQAYGEGGFAQATLQRWRDLGFLLQGLPLNGLPIFGMFLLGAAFVAGGAFADPAAHARLFAALRWIALPLGAGAMLASFGLMPTLDPGRLDLESGAASALGMLGGLLMALGYLALVVRGLQSPRWQRALAWLAPVGRMSLSNYLLQSLVCTLLFYGYGLGGFERLPRFWQLPFVLVLFAAQVGFSAWWLARFRYGPMEWAWRSLTYLRPQPLRLRDA